MSATGSHRARQEPALLRAIEQANRAALAAVDASGRQIYVNPAFCQLTGFDADELLGQSAPFAYWPRDQIAQIESAFQRTVRGDAPADGFCLQFLRKDGLRLDVRLLISPLVAEPGEAGWLACVQNRAEELQAAKTRTDLELMAALVDDSGEGIIFAGTTGEILIFNREAELQHGRSAQPTHATAWASEFGLERSDGTPLPLHETPLWLALQGRRLDGTRWCVRRPDGSLRTLEGTATPVRRSDGSLGGAMLITRDVTDREAEQKALAAALSGFEVARAQSERSLALFDAILETAPLGLSFLDRDLRYVRINKRLAGLNGVAVERTVGRLQREVVPHVADQLEPLYRQVLRTGVAVVDQELHATTPASPELRAFEFSIYPVLDPDGHAVMVGTVVRETTEEKRLQAERSALRERALLAEARAELAQTEANERRFRCLAEATSDIVWTTDPNGVVVTDSASWRAFTGQSVQTWISNHGWDALHPDDRARAAKTWTEAVQRRQRFAIEYRVRRHDGVFVPMSVRGAPVLNEHDEVIEWIGANIDISQRIEQQAERQRLLESEQAARAEAESARSRMALLDRITARLVGEIRGADQVMQTLAEMLVEELGHWCSVQVPRPDGSIGIAAVTHRDAEMAQAARRHVERFPVDPDLSWGVPQVLRSGRAERAVVDDAMIDAYTQDPEQREELRAWSLGSYILVPLQAQGKVIGCLSLVRESAAPAFGDDEQALLIEIGVRAGLSFEQARLLQEAQAARAEAEAASRARDEFLAMLGHELRNPLAPIVTALDLMRLREGQDLSRERGILQRQVRHMTRLVDDLLDVSRIARGKIELRLEPVDLAQICGRAVETTRSLFEQKEQTIDVAVDDDLWIDGDPSRLEQIFNNLLTNANKYTPARGHISMRGQRRGGDVLIEVQDNGVGIDPDLLPHVFDLFIQGRQSIERAVGGLGLGLTIVRRMVDAHGGEVSARSDGHDRGTTMTVTLPLRDAILPGSSPDGPLDALSGTSVGRVLVVDDNEDAATLLAQALRAFGFETRVGHVGTQAIEIARDWCPDSMVLDVGLPGMDGYELARRLRRSDNGHVPLLVAVTGYGQSSDREQAFAAGFSHHLTKPVDLEQLRRILSAEGPSSRSAD